MTIIKACGSIGDIEKGKQIHDEIMGRGFLETDAVLGTALLDMYAKCGELAKAHNLLEELPSRDIVSWNCMLSGCIQHADFELVLECFELMQGEGITPNVVSWSALIAGYVQNEWSQKALLFLEQMQHSGLSPNVVTYLSLLKACGKMDWVERGQELHAEIVEEEFNLDLFVGSSLVHMYVKFGMLDEARDILDSLPERDIVSWTALITGYSEHGHNEEALKCFVQMQAEGVFPNAVTIHCVLKSCSTLQAIKKGQEIHTMIKGNKLLLDHFVCSMLVDMYARCGSLATAQKAFDKLRDSFMDDVIDWI